MPLFSIVTVCFNAESVIVETARSLREQSCTDYEWLVIDGASTDRTLDRVHEAGIPATRVHSEPDRGIYDAMNKGIALGTGEWIYFLNGGDAFADRDVLRDMAAAIRRRPQVRLVFGDMLYVEPAGERLRRFAHVTRATLPFDDLNHQAVFAHRSLFERLGRFNLRFRMSADYDWLLRVFLDRQPTHHEARLIARFAVGGAHSRNMPALLAERRELRLQYVSPARLRLGEQLARVRRRLRLWRDGAR